MADPAARIAVGDEFAGYRIESIVGRGGMGIVYRAISLDHLHRVVALKVVAPEHAEDPEFRRRFVSEVRMAASIEHPNVIPVYEARDVDGVLFLAMRFVEGTDLDRLIAGSGRIAPRRAAEIVAALAAALDRSHARKLVHRDVKPANVLIEREGGHVFLTDFGIARAFDVTGSTGSTHVVGTLDYMAPERFEGRLDRRADIYALGCVLYHALVGEVPFPRSTPAEKIWAHMNAPPPAPAALPAPFRAVIAKALAKGPEQRYDSAGALAAEALRAAASCEEQATDPLPAPGTPPQPSKRRRSTQETVIIPEPPAPPPRLPTTPRQTPRPPDPPPQRPPARQQPARRGGERRRRARRPTLAWAGAALAAGVVAALFATSVLPPKDGPAPVATSTFTTPTNPPTTPTSTIDTSTTPTATTTDTTTPGLAITEADADELLDAYVTAFNDRSRDELYSLVRGAVVRHEANGDTYSGYQEVLDRYDEIFGKYTAAPDLEFTSRDYTADGDDASVVTYYTIGAGPEQGPLTFHLSRFEGGDPEIDDIDLR